MIQERTGLIIWLQDLRQVKNLEKYGLLHYVSKKLNYAVLYIHSDRANEVSAQIQKLPFVKKVERSYRGEIPTEYNSNIPDKTRFYSY